MQFQRLHHGAVLHSSPSNARLNTLESMTELESLFLGPRDQHSQWCLGLFVILLAARSEDAGPRVKHPSRWTTAMAFEVSPENFRASSPASKNAERPVKLKLNLTTGVELSRRGLALPPFLRPAPGASRKLSVLPRAGHKPANAARLGTPSWSQREVPSSCRFSSPTLSP